VKNQNFEKVFTKKDIFALAFGAMIGWGWVVLTGSWIKSAGSMGSILAFLVGGFMVYCVGLTYAELTSALPESGGVSVFTERALGWRASFFSSWAIILGYISVVAFEAVAFPSVLEYFIGSSYLKGYLYTIAGYDVYASWLLVGIVSSLSITAINYFGAKNVAFIQSAVTVLIAIVGLMLFGGSAANGSISNFAPLMINGSKGVFVVAVMTPFMFMGFDVIPQAAEEMNVPSREIGKIMLLSVVMAVLWYIMIVVSVSMALNQGAIESSGLVTADAMQAVFNGNAWASKLLVLAGLGGIITSWNAFFLGGSRAIYAMAERDMIPITFSKIHPKYHTPTKSILLIGVVASIAPIFGKSMLTWLVNAGSFAVVIAYFMVALSFVTLRLKEPKLNRPYSVKHWKIIGSLAAIMSALVILICFPGFPAALSWPYEWGIILIWFGLGGLLYLVKSKGKVEPINFKKKTKKQDREMSNYLVK